MKNKQLLLAAVMGVGFVGLTPLDASAQSKADQIREERREERRDADENRRDPADRGADREVSRAKTDGDRLTFDTLPGEVKRTVGAEMGQNTEVIAVRKITRDDRVLYRVDFEEGTRGRTLFVDEDGKLRRDVNSTEEGRTKVAFDSLPGPVKSALIKANDGQEPRRVYQVTDDRETWYVAYGGEGRIARVDPQGEPVRGAVLLSDRPRNVRIDGERVAYESLPGEVKRTVGAEMGQNTEVVATRKITRDDRVLYRVDFDDGTRGRTLFVDESGKLLRDMNSTEEGRVKVAYNDLPGPVKSALIQANDGKEPRRVYQVTDDRETWYVAYGDEGRIARVDQKGEEIRSPQLLSDRPRNDRADDRPNDRPNDRASDRAKERAGNDRADRKDAGNARTLGHVKAKSDKVEFAAMGKEAKETVREMNVETKVQNVWNVEGGYYVVQLTDGRFFQVGHDGKLLEPRRRDMVGKADADRVTLASLPKSAEEAIRSMNRDAKVERVLDLGDNIYLVEYTDKTYLHVDRDGKVRGN